jgi:hypothetical protein
LKQENRNLKNVVASMIEAVAKQGGLTRLEYEREQDKFVPQR